MRVSSEPWAVWWGPNAQPHVVVDALNCEG